MKSATTRLNTLLASNTFLMADLFTITFGSGTVLRWTSCDIPLTDGTNTWTPMPMKRGTTRVTIGTQVDSIDITIFAGGGANVSADFNVPAVAAFAASGGFDNADVLIEKAFTDSWANAVERLHHFSGLVSDVSPTRSNTVLTVNSYLYLLNVRLPKNLYTPGCRHTLFNADCGLNKNLFSTGYTVGSSPTTTQMVATASQATGYYDQGTIAFTSGVNTGLTRTIKTYTLSGATGTFTWLGKLPQAPAPGDTFNAYPGCNKLLTTCTSKFSNQTKFGGHPYIPSPESAT